MLNTVLFDFDGTLHETGGSLLPHFERYTQNLERMDIPSGIMLTRRS